MTYTRAQATITRGACALYVADGVTVSEEDIEAGFRWLETWDIVMPIKSYTKLADGYFHPDPECLAKTEAKVFDMRQPVYDERVMFIRHGEGMAPNSLGSSADTLLAAREDENCNDPTCPLPMLRAVWKVKPLLLAVPVSWVQEVA